MDKSKYDETIVTLLVEEGNTPGKPIATYLPGKKERYIVKLPSSAPVGQNVRVKLFQQDFPDKRGEPVFVGKPAPVEYSESWKDNGDGTISLMVVSTNWLGQTSDEGAKETRAIGKREGTPSVQSNFQVMWGSDLMTSILEDHQATLIPLEEEKVEGGKLVWRKVSERTEPLPVLSYPITKVEIRTCELYNNKLNVTIDPKWSVCVYVYYRKPENSSDSSYSHTATWETMPAWWQTEWETRYPVCSCSKSRRDSQVSDGYGKCETCRAEETCVRCGQQKTVKNLSGRLVCRDCEPYEGAEQLIETLLPQIRRQELAAEASRLLAATALAQAEGELILKETMGHIDDNWGKDKIVAKCTGYGWYYFSDDGVFGTKLAPAALTVLQYLPQATGNGLVELVAWLSGGAKPDSSDFYTHTQVKGEKVTLPSLEDTIRKLATWSLGLADKLRGSEADRIEAVSLFEQVKTSLGDRNEGVVRAQKIFNAIEQDFRAAIDAIRDCQTVAVLQESVQAAIENHFATCPLCGEAMSLGKGTGECRNSHDTDLVTWERDESGEEIRTTVVELLTESGLVVARMYISVGRRYHGDVNIETPSGEGCWDRVTPFTKLSLKNYGRVISGKQAEALRKNWQQVKEMQNSIEHLKDDLRKLQESAETSQAQWDEAEVAALAHLDANYRTDPVKAGTVYEVTFEAGVGKEQGQFVCGPFFDVAVGDWVKLIADPYDRVQARAGVRCFARVRAKNSQTLQLFVYQTDNPNGPKGAGGRRVQVYGYFAVPIMKPETFEQEIEKAKRELAEAINELEQIQSLSMPIAPAKTQKVEAHPQEVETNEDPAESAMAFAMRKAGLIK